MNLKWIVTGLLVVQTALQAVASTNLFTPEQRGHWAFRPVARVSPPNAAHSSWVRNPVDSFILAEQQKLGIKPSPEADKTTLLRRASLDVTGIPPTPAETEAFLADNSPEAYDHAIDRLLASHRYGLRWARHWLDLARYAESEGFKADETRPNAWRYRDYVIQSLNQDKPYNRFIQEQLAGDELFPGNPEALIATGFNRHYPDESNARNLMQRRQEILNDMTDTAGAVFTGLTFACARCHDHKTDPILQADYYRLQAFFANSGAADQLDLLPPEASKSYRARLASWENKTRAIREEMARMEKPHREAILADYIEKYPEEIQAALKKPEGIRTPFEWQMVHKARQYIDPASHQYLAPSSAIAGRFKGEDKKKYEQLKSELATFAPLHPGELPITAGITDVAPSAPATFVLKRGVYDSQREEVEPGFLTILDESPARVEQPKNVRSSGRRAALARIISDPANPLTSRVMVNRIWQFHFGQGIVASPSDFGIKGERPSHPELLDWLASEFVRSGWSMKHVHRLILTSGTYRQSSSNRPETAARDPENKTLWRFPRHRLEGESIRDSALAVAGLLNPQMGGPSIFPEMPAGLEVRGGWKVSAEEAQRNRSSIYVFVRRNTRYPLFESFDMPDTHETCARRNNTVSPGQALNLLNSPNALKWAEAFAGRVQCEATSSDREARIRKAFDIAFSRGPSKKELGIAQDFFKRHHALLADRAGSGQPLPSPRYAAPPLTGDKLEAAALVDFCHMLLNANEFVYVN